MSPMTHNGTLRGAMIGGGPGSMIGPVHRIGISFDPQARLVAGVFSRSREKNRAMARELGIGEERCYDSVDEFIRSEARRPWSERVDWVSVVTPNVAHYGQIKALIEAGYHVVADKPLTATWGEAQALHETVIASGRFFGLTHTYAGYPMIKEMRFRIARGDLGRIHKVVVQYAQGWMMGYLAGAGGAVGTGGAPGAEAPPLPWRTTRAAGGDSCTTADIGTHAAHLVRYTTGLEIRRLLAATATFLPGNELEDDAAVIIDYVGGARGVLVASQSSTGERNNMVLNVYGERGGMEWRHSRPAYLTLKQAGGEVIEIDSGMRSLETLALGINRRPTGHPEGPNEAFANLYREAFRAIRARRAGEDPGPVDMPDIDDGLFGMRFVERVLASATEDSTWMDWSTTQGAAQ